VHDSEFRIPNLNIHGSLNTCSWVGKYVTAGSGGKADKPSLAAPSM
jgi:hypothetical protein